MTNQINPDRERTLADQIDTTALLNRIAATKATYIEYGPTPIHEFAAEMAQTILRNQLAIMQALVDLTTPPVVQIKK